MLTPNAESWGRAMMANRIQRERMILRAVETLVIIIMTHEKRFGCFTGPDNERLLREVLDMLDWLKAEVGVLEEY